MKAFRITNLEKPIHQKVKLHYHNFIFSTTKKILRVTLICQKGADIRFIFIHFEVE